MSRAPMKPTSAGYPITFDIQEQTLDRLNRMALTDPARATHRGDGMRTDRIYIADESHLQSIGRGDLGAVYQLLKDLEWSQSRNGCQLHPGWVPITARCCVSCSGVQPSYFQPEAFPTEANGHTSDCRLLAAILTLRSALGAIE